MWDKTIRHTVNEGAFQTRNLTWDYRSNVQQPDVNVGPGGHFQTQDNANKRPDNLPFSGAIVRQLEVLDSIEMVFYVNFL